MRFLSSNDADWERRHPVTLLFFLFMHLYVLIHASGSVWLLVGITFLLILERRFPIGLLSILLVFVVISISPILFNWNISPRLISQQSIQLGIFLFGMVWGNRFLKLERLLPLLSKWPRSSKLLYSGWALIPSMERAIRLSLRSHSKKDWQDAVVIGIESQRQEPRYAIERLQSFHSQDMIQLLILFILFIASIMWLPMIWLLYPYLTRGGVRDAMVIFRRRSAAN
jgi:hypothetical protein